MTIKEFNEKSFEDRCFVCGMDYGKNLNTQRIDPVKRIRYMLYIYSGLILEVSDNIDNGKYIDCLAVSKMYVELNYKDALLEN